MVIVLTTEFDINMNNSRAGNLQVGKGGLPRTSANGATD
jgi:hypothetical protein